MERIYDGKYHFNEDYCWWERAEKEQEYKGIKIISVTTHGDFENAPRHRYYIVIWGKNNESIYPINKRGSNIKSLKQYIDFKQKYPTHNI